MSDEQRTQPYTTAELAAAARVSDRYVRRLVADGKIAGTMYGKTWLIPAEEGERFLREKRSRWEKF